MAVVEVGVLVMEHILIGVATGIIDAVDGIGAVGGNYRSEILTKH